jgi:hypothetical protein
MLIYAYARQNSYLPIMLTFSIDDAYCTHTLLTDIIQSLSTSFHLRCCAHRILAVTPFACHVSPSGCLSRPLPRSSIIENAFLRCTQAVSAATLVAAALPQPPPRCLAASPLRRLASLLRAVESHSADRPFALARLIYMPDLLTVTLLYSAYKEAISENQRLTPGALMPLAIPGRVGQTWSQDAVTGLPTTRRGHDAIQVY